ncbi:MFS transporter [Ferrimonas aestuarii]|uniref:hypothetical protein n=1 Tax=Ferrimonas aestuarii TaxID=2569539 RepID=UPI002D2190CA|nr:hypothetical protein [Ferrimonas aestuarii]
MFQALSISALLLLVCTALRLPETKSNHQPMALSRVVWAMLRDRYIWLSAILVAAYNIALFAYYQQGSAIFANLGSSAEQFGYSGVVLGVSTLVGSALNRALLAKGAAQGKLLGLAAGLLLIGAVSLWLLEHSIWLLVPMAVVVMAFGIAIPNVLSTALANYRHCAGSAGALFGLLYYLLIGSGLMLSAELNNLGVTLILLSGVIGVATFARGIATTAISPKSS